MFLIVNIGQTPVTVLLGTGPGAHYFTLGGGDDIEATHVEVPPGVEVMKRLGKVIEVRARS